jgi:exopolysaccharide biosynthesis operon protein EpsL
MYSRLRPMAGALLLACAAFPAQALEGDRIRPSVGLTYTYTDNVFYLDDRIPNAAAPYLKSNQRNDTTLGLRLGLDIDHYWNRQTFVLRSQVTENRHITYDSLDYQAYNVRGTWNWVVGERWDGDAGIEKTQVASNLYDFFANNQRETRNLRTQTAMYASAMLRMSADWKLRAAVRHVEIENSLSRFRGADQQQWITEVGTRHYSKGTDDFLGLTFRYVDGDFPNRTVVGASTIDNGFRQYTLEGNVEYQLSGLTRITGSAGLTTRRHPQVSQRDFTGPTGRVNLTYRQSDKTTLTTAVFQEIGAWEDATSSYILTRGFSVTPSYSISDKLVAQGNYALRQRSFEGDPNFVTTTTDKRVDRIHSLSATLSWLPLRQTRIDMTLSYDKRKANAAFGSFSDFDATSLYVSGQLTF